MEAESCRRRAKSARPRRRPRGRDGVWGGVAHNHAPEMFGERRSPRPPWNTDKDAAAPWRDGKENGRKVHSETVAKNAIVDPGKGIGGWRRALPGKKNGQSGRRTGFSRFRKRDGSGDGRHASNGRRARLPMVGRVNTTKAVRFAESLIAEETVTRPGKTASGEQGVVSPEERKRETRAWRSFPAFSDTRRKVVKVEAAYCE